MPVRSLLLPVVVFFFLPSSVISLELSGNVSTSFWAYEDTSSHFMSYQHLRLKGTSSSLPGLSFKTNLRWAGDLNRDFSGTDNTRLYNALLGWTSSNGDLNLAVGRQFYTLGVGSGTLDGFRMALKPKACCNLQIYAGIEAPATRKAELRDWSEGNVYGFRLSRQTGSKACELSWVRKSRDDNVYWHQVGGRLSRRFGKFLNARMRVDYNMAASELQLVRLSGRYQPGAVAIWAEGSSQAPRVAEDSFFRIFDLDRFSQVRIGARYTFSRRNSLGTEFIGTMYSDETAERVRIKLRTGPLTVGTQLRVGDGAGEQTAFFGSVDHRLGAFRGRVGIDVSQYKLSDRYEETDQTALLAGLAWKPERSRFSARIQVQRLVNRGYDEDYRAFGRLALDF